VARSRLAQLLLGVLQADLEAGNLALEFVGPIGRLLDRRFELRDGFLEFVQSLLGGLPIGSLFGQAVFEVGDRLLEGLLAPLGLFALLLGLFEVVNLALELGDQLSPFGNLREKPSSRSR
jgi:hypothetical protein